MKSRTEILVPLAAIQAVPIAVIAWYRLHRYAWYRYSAIVSYVVDVEVHTPNGRVDIVLLTDIRLYIIELKLNRDAQTALQQINLKNYAQRFALCGKPIVKVGINFDSTLGNIEDWIIEENDKDS